MSFYLKPPKGLANVNCLEDTARQRVKCYENLFNENIRDVIVELECLIEDSVLDRLGHNLFRLLALKSNTFCSIFLTNEIKLLDLRLSCYGREDLRHFIKKLRKHSTECLQVVQIDGRAKELFMAIIRICTQMLQKGFLEHGLRGHNEVCEECHQFQINVNFQLCPDLLATRQYNIIKGCLQINCYQWKNLLLSLFNSYLLQAIKEMRYLPKVHDAFQDDRIRNVLIIIRTLLLKSNVNSSENERGTFKLEDFHQESVKFPFCMRNLYGILKKINRLGHNARFDFSLYLKGIGLSMDDALTFWRNAYSKQHASCSRCTHSWQDNEKRYIYGIRHLYGLEGSRKNYAVKSCHQIQDMTLAANEEGGCPFRHFDDNNLRRVLKGCLPEGSCDQVEVIIYERKENAKKACELFLAEQLHAVFRKTVTEGEIAFQDPGKLFHRSILFIDQKINLLILILSFYIYKYT